MVSVGSGREGESGVVTDNAGVKPGDLVYCRVRVRHRRALSRLSISYITRAARPPTPQFPYGIGPKDEEFAVEGDVRRFSFIRYQDVAAVVG